MLIGTDLVGTTLPSEATLYGHLPISKHALLALLCFLVPLAALAALLYLHTSTVPTTLVALIVLIPLGRWLLRSAWDDRH